MRIPRFFFAGDLVIDAVVTLSVTASHHLCNVLRIDPGQPVMLFNGDGKEYLGRFIDRQQKLARVCILSVSDGQTESPLFIELGQAISRGDKMDYAIQKAVELGVNRIVPLFTERCAVKFKQDRQENRLTHWQGVITHACEQSGRCVVPDIASPLTLTDWLAQKREGLCFVCDFAPPQPLSNLNRVHRVTILIGPEGGLSAAEITHAKTVGFLGLSLGPRTLRTETATVAALTLLQNRWGDLSQLTFA
jgi:16S rRNA (uracil1498-N3)-methyltransferase